MDSADTVKAFYEAFKVRNGDAMASLYADDVEFCDPVFLSLKGIAAKSMWRMLCSKAHDLEVTYKIEYVNGHNVQVRWEARYTFVATGRFVVNHVVANIKVEDGKIRQHLDTFDFWRWASQAIGPVGFLLGWTPILKKKIRDQAAKSLEVYLNTLSRV